MKSDKIAIISELNLRNVNYGNRLQAYALNFYLSTKLHIPQVDSLALENFKRSEQFKYTKIGYIITKKILKKTTGLLRRDGKSKNSNKSEIIANRMKKFDDFQTNHPEFSVREISYGELINSDYDTFVVGSDVVWGQLPGKVNKIKFLDFKNKRDFKKVSYAPSFSRDFFPTENRRFVKQCLDDFDAISVRDRFSQRLLSEIGIKAQRVCDPTLLLSKSEWSKLAKKPGIKKKYIFVYLLGINSQCRKQIEDLAGKMNLKIATIPCADENLGSDVDFGDYQVPACSPEEWIGLIQNAEYVFTDSFHGTIFSTIFGKKVLAIQKVEKGKSATDHPPDRMMDFLETIGEKDKYTPVPDAETLRRLKWNYGDIGERIKAYKDESEKFLKDNLL